MLNIFNHITEMDDVVMIEGGKGREGRITPPLIVRGCGLVTNSASTEVNPSC